MGMDRFQHLLYDTDGGIARITLQRPQLHNAFNAELIAELTEAIRRTRDNDQLRVLLLSGSGESFSAGGDLNWMQAMASASREDNRLDSLRLAAMFRTLDNLPKPVIARVNGHAFGGGVGLISCCDISIAVQTARFALSEVRLGLIPATIAPFVQARIGMAGMRRYALSGERFDAQAACQIGLISAIAADQQQLDEMVLAQTRQLLHAAPTAVAECKQLIRKLSRNEWSADATDKHTAAWIARIRAGEEGQHGLHAFLHKQKARWQPS
jgi:methylglutaconyl-CoA hydratase